ncbi:amino acid permease [Parendozoicomonas haliclonae]|uniref:Arginine/agmatine antiporter n=1 Tax=Parendozoicomonas haliclonae TaxID=1960125 RepID=A0A1X7ANB0_9GAMM|nr:amino acid permease [Parendozoicomonas haliclonae]SMA48282.1 Arginine/agmatine antiporter [Parendozoicomonas haliclonae]
MSSDAAKDRTSAKKLGLVGATYLIVSSLAGSGVIALPQQLAFTGSITLVSFILVTIGALCLTMVYVRAGERFEDPSPTALASTVSPIIGAKCGFFYVYGNLISNVSILIAGLGYLAMFIPQLNDPIVLGITIIALIWLFVGMSLRGVGIISQVVSITVTFLLIAVVLTSVLGWVDFSPDQFGKNWNVSGSGPAPAIMAGFAILIFSYVGVESVATNAEQIENPKRVVPLATIIGFLIVAAFYILSTTVIEGMFTAKEIQDAPASFALSMEKIFGSMYVGHIVSLVMSVACIASFMVWGLNSVSAAKTSADKGFLPKAYTYTNKYGIASKGLVINGVIMTVVELILMMLGSNIAEAFNLSVTISVLLLLFPYFWSGIALIKKDYQEGVKSTTNKVYVALSSIFLISAFASGNFDELMIVIGLNMIVPGVYAILINVKFVTLSDDLKPGGST